MAEYRIKGGYTLTDEDFERMAEEAECGEYPGTPGAWIVRPQGRPALSDEELVTIAFKVPRSQRDALDRKAESLKESRSQFMRDALNRALAAE
jgi:hypothetical protein